MFTSRAWTDNIKLHTDVARVTTLITDHQKKSKPTKETAEAEAISLREIKSKVAVIRKTLKGLEAVMKERLHSLETKS